MLFSVNKNLLEAFVLASLYKGDSYGYRLTQEVKSFMGISDSTLYPVLRRLEAEDFLTTYDDTIDGRNRKYYAITPSGKLQHLQNINSWHDYRNILDKIFE